MMQPQLVSRTLRKSTLASAITVLAVGLLAGAARAPAVTMTWTNGNDVWTSATAWTTNTSTAFDTVGLTNVECAAQLPSGSTFITNCVGGTGGVPAIDDQARFTNNTSYVVTVNVTTNLSVLTVSNTAGVVTLDASGFSLTVTGRVRIADSGATSTVVWAGGTLTVATGPNSLTEIASSTSTTNAVGVLMVTNGTVMMERNVSLGGVAGVGAVGKLIVSGPGVVTNNVGMNPAANFVLRPRSPGSQLIVTNGGKLFWAGEVRADSNSVMLVSDPGSLLYCTNVPGVTACLSAGGGSDPRNTGNMLIVSNGATVLSDGTISIGRNGSGFNTGIVVGAGSKLIAVRNATGINCITVGVGGAGGNNNHLSVYDGGYIECLSPGSFLSVPGGTCTNTSFFMGGVGAMSTGFAVSVRANSAGRNNLIVVTNAVFTCSVLGQQGAASNALFVLSKGTLIFSNQYAAGAATTNVLNGNNGLITIDGGTISAVSGTNALGVRIGVNAGVPGCTLTITNGGKLLSELGTIGAGSSFNTGIVTGAGSVWSNTATISVGDSSGINNTLLIDGGVVFAGKIRVRSTNTLAFTAGTLTVGAMDIDSGANGSNVFVVGDGTSAAYYDMVPGGEGYHGFSNGGLVVTNGAFLRGSGTLTGTIVVRGTFVPGFANSVGSIFTSNSLSFAGPAVLEYDLGTNSDFVTVGGNLGLGSSILNVTDSGGFGAGIYVLFQHTNTVTAPSGTLTVGTLPAGFSATVSNDLDNAQVLLVVTPTGGGDPYTTWASSYGLTGGNALGGADPDGDGVSNTNEFLAGFNPTNSAAYPHIISVVRSGNDMNIIYLGANGDSTWSPGIASRTNVLEFTTGAVNGSYSNNFASTGQTNILSGGTGSGVVTNMVDPGGATNSPSRYYRVRVLAP